MAPYYGPQESASDVTFEQYFLATEFISGIGYGIQGVLYFICTRYLWTQRKARRMNLFMLAYITLMFLISTVAQVAQAHRTQLVFIENRNFPGGPWEYFGASLSGTVNIVGQTPTVALVFLSEAFMVWRCWVVWYSVSRRAAYIVASIPTLMLIASIIGAVLYYFAVVHPDSLIPWVHTIPWITIYYTLALSTNVVTTGFILIRLIMHKRAVRKTLASEDTGEYTSLISMLIESAALYSIIGGSCLILTGVGSPAGWPFVNASTASQQISGYLIIARLAHGRGWQKSTMPVHSKIVIRRNMSTRDTQAGSEGGASDGANVD